MAYKSSFQDFVEHEKKDIVEDMHNPKCKKCNECCSAFALISKTEYDSLKRYVDGTSEGRKLYKAAVDRILKFKREQDTIYLLCPFTGEDKKCAIYRIRPQICREFHCDATLNKVIKENKKEDRPHTIADLFREVYWYTIHG